MRRLVVSAFAVAVASSVTLLARPARADVTTWLAFGTGLAVDHSTANRSTNWSPGISGSIGLGSDPTHAVVVGGVFRLMSRVNEGADMNLALRVSTGGYSRGDWGFAVDVGPGLRLWESNQDGTFPLQGALVLGAPWGVQLTLGSDIMNLAVHPSSVGGFALVEFDLLRFTVMRQGSTDRFWKNPIPAGGRMEDKKADPGPRMDLP